MVHRHTHAGNPVEARAGRVQDFRRDSKGLARLRAQSLSSEEKDIVRRITYPIAEQVYGTDALRRLEYDS
jgi:hypothetical protein